MEMVTMTVNYSNQMEKKFKLFPFQTDLFVSGTHRRLPQYYSEINGPKGKWYLFAVSEVGLDQGT